MFKEIHVLTNIWYFLLAANSITYMLLNKETKVVGNVIIEKQIYLSFL